MEILTAISSFLFIVVFADLIGRSICRLLKYPSFLSLRCGLGFGIISFTLFTLSLFRCLDPMVILITSAIIYCWLFVINYRDITPQGNNWDIFKSLALWPKLLSLLLAAYLIITFLHCLHPSLARDSLFYHLSLPKMWLAHAEMFTIPENLYSFFPHLWNLIYLYALSLSNDITCSLLHWFTLLLSLQMIYRTAVLIYPQISIKNALMVCLVFIATPSVSVLTSFAYTDLALTFFILIGLFFILSYTQTHNRLELIFAGLFAGFSLCVKYQAIIWVFLLPIILFSRKNFKKALKASLFFWLISLSISAPYFIRNYLASGNPIFPLLNNIFQSSFMDSAKYTEYLSILDLFGPGKTLRDLFFLPFRLSFLAEFNRPLKFDGGIGPLYLLLFLPFLFKIKKIKLPSQNLFFLLSLFLLSWFYQLSQQVRYLFPALAIFLAFCSGLFTSHRTTKIISSLIIIYAFYPLTILVGSCSHNKYYNFLIGKENRKAFLQRNLSMFSLIEKYNTIRQPDSRIMTINAGGICYYLDGDVVNESVIEDYTFIERLRSSPDSLRNYFSSRNITHLLINETKLIQNCYDYGKERLLYRYFYFKNKYLTPIDSLKNVVLFRLKEK